jgi:hypothetical protein
MKIKELLEIVRNRPGIEELEISIVSRPVEKVGGMLDGAPSALTYKIQTVMHGADGLILWPDKSSEWQHTFHSVERIREKPEMYFVYGPMPEYFKSL